MLLTLTSSVWRALPLMSDEEHRDPLCLRRPVTSTTDKCAAFDARVSFLLVKRDTYTHPHTHTYRRHRRRTASLRRRRDLTSSQVLLFPHSIQITSGTDERTHAKSFVEPVVCSRNILSVAASHIPQAGLTSNKTNTNSNATASQIETHALFAVVNSS